MDIRIFGKEIIDANSITQLENAMLEDSIGVLTADAHYGYNHPIGGAIAYKNHISLSGVGFDIACGNKCVKTDIHYKDIDIGKVMVWIWKKIGFGMGMHNPHIIRSHEVYEKIEKAKFEPQRKMLGLVNKQLGTVGGGNHYVDIFKDEEGMVRVGVHFGSRGFGHKTTTGFIALSQGLKFTDKGKEGPMDGKPILFEADSELGIAYMHAMELAGEVAYAGRDTVCSRVVEFLGGNIVEEVHNHHNFLWKENHYGENYYVVRKGCTPCNPGQKGFIGSTMSDISVIIEGVESEQNKSSLYSTVHGAGRNISRSQAKGKFKRKKVDGGRKFIQKSPGLINYDEVKEEMKNKGIELRGGGADEAPGCYKKLDEVLSYHSDSINILHRLEPIGVAMAG